MSNVKDSLGNIATKLMGYPLGFVSSVIVARVLGPEDRGVYSYLLVLVSFLLPIFSLGIGSGFTYLISNGKYKTKDVLFSVLVFSLVTGILLGLIVASFWWLGLLGETGALFSSFHIKSIIFVLVCSTIYFFLGRLLLGDSQFSLQNKITILVGIIHPILMLLIVAYLNKGLNGAIIAYLISQLFSLIWLLISLSKKYSITHHLNWTFLKESLTYGFKGWFGDMAIKANVRLDQIILGGVVSASSLGIYSIAVLLSELLWIVPDSIGLVLFNILAKENDDVVKVNLIYKINRLLFFMSIILSVFLFLGTKYVLIPFGYGQAYIGVLLPLLIIIPGSIFYILAKVITKILSGSGYIGLTSKATFFGSLSSILLYFLLIPQFGIVGAAIASSIGYTIVSLFCLYYFYITYKKSIIPFFTLQTSDFYWVINLIRKKSHV